MLFALKAENQIRNLEYVLQAKKPPNNLFGCSEV